MGAVLSGTLIMKLVVISAALLGAVLASQESVRAYRDLQFAAFREQHGKQYSSKAELELRRDIFHANLVKIEKHNALGTWKMGVNEFSDLTQAEFEAQMTGGYSSGVYSGCAYDSNIALNHAVQLVGYGTDSTP